VNFFTLVLTALLVVLFLIRLSSLCRWRFSAELIFFFANVNPHILYIIYGGLRRSAEGGM